MADRTTKEVFAEAAHHARELIPAKLATRTKLAEQLAGVDAEIAQLQTVADLGKTIATDAKPAADRKKPGRKPNGTKFTEKWPTIQTYLGREKEGMRKSDIKNEFIKVGASISEEELDQNLQAGRERGLCIVQGMKWYPAEPIPAHMTKT